MNNLKPLLSEIVTGASPLLHHGMQKTSEWSGHAVYFVKQIPDLFVKNPKAGFAAMMIVNALFLSVMAACIASRLNNRTLHPLSAGDAQLRSQLAAIQLSLTDAETEKTRIAARLQTIQTERDAFQKSNDEHSEKNRSLKRALTSSREILRKLKVHVAARISGLRRQHASREKMLQGEIQGLESHLMSLNESHRIFCENLTEDLDTLEHDTNRLEMQIAEKNEEIAQLRKQLNQLPTEINGNWSERSRVNENDISFITDTDTSVSSTPILPHKTSSVSSHASNDSDASSTSSLTPKTLFTQTPQSTSGTKTNRQVTPERLKQMVLSHRREFQNSPLRKTATPHSLAKQAQLSNASSSTQD